LSSDTMGLESRRLPRGCCTVERRAPVLSATGVGIASGIVAATGFCVDSDVVTVQVKAVVSALVICSLITSWLAWKHLTCEGKGRLERGRNSDVARGTSEEASRQLGCSGAQALRVDEDQLDWFLGELARIHAVQLDPGQTHTVSPPRRATIRAAFDDMRIAAASMEQAPSLHEPIDDVFFGRLLVATDFDVTKSMKLARAYVAFRREMGGSIPPPLEIMRTRSFMLPFCDVSGRPVLFVRGKYVDTRLKVETLRKMFRAFQDAIILQLLRQRSGVSQTNPLEQYLVVIDMDGAGWSNVSLSALKMLVCETTTKYPDRVQEFVLLGFNSTARRIWSVLAPFVHPRTRQKVKMVAPDDAVGLMSSLIERDLLPSTYGGTGKPFAEDEGSCLADRLGVIAADAWNFLERDALRAPVSESETTAVTGRKGEDAPVRTVLNSCFAGVCLPSPR